MLENYPQMIYKKSKNELFSLNFKSLNLVLPIRTSKCEKKGIVQWLKIVQALCFHHFVQNCLILKKMGKLVFMLFSSPLNFGTFEPKNVKDILKMTDLWTKTCVICTQDFAHIDKNDLWHWGQNKILEVKIESFNCSNS